MTPRESKLACIRYHFSAFQITLIAQGHCPAHIWTLGMSHVKRHPQTEVSVLFHCSNEYSLLGPPVKQIKGENRSIQRSHAHFHRLKEIGLKETGPGRSDFRHLPRIRTLLLRMFFSLPQLLPWQASVVWQLGVVGGHFCGLAAYFSFQLWEWALTLCSS